MIAAFLVPQVCHSQANEHTALAAQTKSFEGCYELKLSRWWPQSFGEDTEFVTPPSRVRLLPERGTEGWEKCHLLVRALPGRKGKMSARGGPSFWNLKSSSEIELVWTDGFTGLALGLRKHGKEHHGWTHPHFDAPTWVPRIAHVTARRIACETPR